MREKKEYLIKGINLTKFVQWCNENHKKQSGKDFTVSDLQGYTRRGYLPVYLGDIKIETNKESGIPLYSLYKPIEDGE